MVLKEFPLNARLFGAIIQRYIYPDLCLCIYINDYVSIYLYKYVLNFLFGFRSVVDSNLKDNLNFSPDDDAFGRGRQPVEQTRQPDHRF